jgi:hypothetical protein
VLSRMRRNIGCVTTPASALAKFQYCARMSASASRCSRIFGLT